MNNYGKNNQYDDNENFNSFIIMNKSIASSTSVGINKPYIKILQEERKSSIDRKQEPIYEYSWQNNQWFYKIIGYTHKSPHISNNNTQIVTSNDTFLSLKNPQNIFINQSSRSIMPHNMICNERDIESNNIYIKNDIKMDPLKITLNDEKNNNKCSDHTELVSRILCSRDSDEANSENDALEALINLNEYVDQTKVCALRSNNRRNKSLKIEEYNTDNSVKNIQ